MGVTCKPIGKFRGILKKVEKQQEEKKKEANEQKERKRTNKS